MFYDRLSREDLLRFRDAWASYEASDRAPTFEDAKRHILDYIELIEGLVERYEIDDEQDFSIDPATGAIRLD